MQKKCLSLQKILFISFPDNFGNLTYYYIYLITLCQNNHYENKRLEKFDYSQYEVNISELKCSSCNLLIPIY